MFFVFLDFFLADAIFAAGSGNHRPDFLFGIANLIRLSEYRKHYFTFFERLYEWTMSSIAPR